MITLIVNCIMCGSEHSIAVPEEGFNQWQRGVAIQYALPGLTASERELLISGVCPVCWDKLFK